MKKSFFDINRIPYADRILRAFGFVFFSLFIIHRFAIISNYGSASLLQVSPVVFYSYRMLWFFETLVFFIYAGAYLIRKPAKKLAQNFFEALFPFICAALPFLMIRESFLSALFPGCCGAFQDLTLIRTGSTTFYIVQADINLWPLFICISVMLAGSVIMVISLISLRRSFSIMAEARELVTNGIYKYIRHPLYLGEFIAYLGVLIMRFSLINTLIFVLFVVLQTYRAKIEEKKLLSEFPEYEDYMKKTGMFTPHP